MFFLDKVLLTRPLLICCYKKSMFQKDQFSYSKIKWKKTSKCFRGPNLWIWLLRDWGRCLKVALQTRAAENFRYCWWWAEWRVSHAQTRELASPSPLIEIFRQIDDIYVHLMEMSEWLDLPNFELKILSLLAHKWGGRYVTLICNFDNDDDILWWW